MGIVLVFLLVVVFVAVIWGREAAQKLFKGGVWIAAAVFAVVAGVVIFAAATLKAPTPLAIQQQDDVAHQSAYYVPPNQNTSPNPYQVPLNDGLGNYQRTPTTEMNTQVSAAQTGAAYAPAVPAYVPPISPQQYANAAPVPAPIVGGKPHFGFGYAPINGYVRVTDCYPGGPAYEAGIIPGMAILVIGGVKIRECDDVWQAQNRRYRIGDIVPFIVGDLDGTTKAFSIRLASDAEPWGVNVNR